MNNHCEHSNNGIRLAIQNRGWGASSLVIGFFGVIFSAITFVGCADRTLPWERSDDELDNDAPTNQIALTTEQQTALSEIRLTREQDLINSLRMKDWHDGGWHGQGITVAILDNGFAGLDLLKASGDLPADAELITTAPNPPQDTIHGTVMAQLVYRIAAGAESTQPQSPSIKLLLINSNGYTNFSNAVDQAIVRGAQVILYSQVWEYGGNFDGQGFINAVVSKATQRGLVWVNAAGNFALNTFNGMVDPMGQPQLPHRRQDGSTSIRITAGKAQAPVRVVLAWNDFTNSVDYRTPRDLDLWIEDARGNIVGESRLIQDGKDHSKDTSSQEQYSAHAREIVTTTLPAAGTYHIRISPKSGALPIDTRFRVTADGQEVEVLDRSIGETILTPADHPQVMTVGAGDDINSSFAQLPAGVKPEVLASSKIVLGSGRVVFGSSNAAAIVAGSIAVLGSAYGAPTRGQVMSWIASGWSSEKTGGIAPRFVMPVFKR